MYSNLYEAPEQDAPRILTPEMAAEYPDLVADMKRHPSLQARWAGYIVKKAQVQAVLAASEQLAIAQANAEVGPRSFVKGLGQQVASIAPAYFNFLCWKYGPSWFRDKDTLKDTLKRHPEMKVKSKPSRTTIVSPGIKGLKQFETRLPLADDDDFPVCGCGTVEDGAPPLAANPSSPLVDAGACITVAGKPVPDALGGAL